MFTNGFVRGGVIHPWSGSSRNLGDASHYWSIAAYPIALHAYLYGFNSADVYPSISYDRAYGFSVRCLAL